MIGTAATPLGGDTMIIDVMVGAGAVVVKPVATGMTVVGSPAMPLILAANKHRIDL